MLWFLPEQYKAINYINIFYKMCAQMLKKTLC